jgi:hypothetical protein
MKYPLLALLIIFSASLSANCDSLNKIQICHTGAGADPAKNSVEICPDFGALWGHLVQHPADKIGPCQVDLEENLKIWACNAGIVHKDHTDTSCFDMNQGGVQVTSCQGLNNCLCSGDSLPQSLFQFDFMSFNSAPYLRGQTLAPFSSNEVTSGRYTYEQASQSQGTDRLEEEQGVSFFLGSERFGTQYFADICWEYLDDSLKNAKMKIVADLFLTEDLFNSGNGYLSTAEVSQKSAVFCDKSNSNGQVYNYNTTPVYTTTELPYVGGTRSIQTTDQGSRSCFVRMLFKENQKDILRPYDLKKVQRHSKLEVTPVGDIGGTDGPIEFCHVQKIRGNQYQCQTLSFPNTSSLRSYMQTGYSNIRDWNQDHNFDYRGACRQTCGPLTGNEANQ